MDNIIAESKVSSRGQIAIPKEIKRRLDIDEGDYLLFIDNGDDIELKKGKMIVIQNDFTCSK